MGGSGECPGRPDTFHTVTDSDLAEARLRRYVLHFLLVCTQTITFPLKFTQTVTFSLGATWLNGGIYNT